MLSYLSVKWGQQILPLQRSKNSGFVLKKNNLIESHIL